MSDSPVEDTRQLMGCKNLRKNDPWDRWKETHVWPPFKDRESLGHMSVCIKQNLSPEKTGLPFTDTSL